MSHRLHCAHIAANRTNARRRPGRSAALAAALAGLLLAGRAQAAADIPIPNASFENPTTFFAYPDADTWDESGPVGEDPQLPGVSDTLDTGVFFNSPFLEGGVPSPYYIANSDGNQIGFIGAADASTIAFFQVLPTRYETGARYTLNLLVGESFFFPPLTYNPNDPNPPPSPPPALLAVSLFYVDSSGARSIVAERIVSAAEMPSGADKGVLLVDVGTTGAPVASGDAWRGAPIGILIRPVLGLAGVWNVDHARLAAACSVETAGDVDLDADVDLADQQAFARCFSGPGATTRPEACQPCEFERLDADFDGDVDLYDQAVAARLTGV